MQPFSFGLLLLLGFIVYSKSVAQDTIHWKPDYKIRWEDFQGKPDSNSKYKAVSTPAINYSLSYNENNFTCKVFCFFKKKKSWIIVKDSILLKHEQGHFDIAELFARKFRKKIKEYKFNYLTISEDIEIIFKSIIKERKKFDTMYDTETNLSRNKLKQLYWSNKIKTDLKKLEAYKE